ncbi:MAG TPA: peptidylprolyl isomerase [Gammaproteobacteria bacterium]
MPRLLKDPLIHFLLLGGLLFVLYAWRGEPEADDPFRIVVTSEEVESVRQALALLHGQDPTDEQVRATIEPRIKDEILYREAIALGLDEDDSLVRARLTEKMLFLTQDVAEPVAPTDAEVEAFFADDPARFFVPAAISFEQRFFSPSFGGGAELAARAAIRALRAGSEAVVTDDVLFDDRYDGITQEAIANAFGDAFASALAELAPGSGWQGPLRSDFGFHAVRVIDRADAYQPGLDEIRAEVTTALVAQRRLEANEAEYRKLRARYDVVYGAPASAGTTNTAE